LENYAIQETNSDWKMKWENLSKSFTTNINDIPTINLNIG